MLWFVMALAALAVIVKIYIHRKEKEAAARVESHTQGAKSQ
jgi:hypothetical protein